MSWQAIKDYLDTFRTDRLMEQLHAWNVGELHTSPWLLGILAVVIVISWMMRWKALTAILVGVGGFVLTVSWTVSKGVGTEGIQDGGLYIIVGGGALAVILFIYLVFIKTE